MYRAIKKLLRKLFPVSRNYIDSKIKEIIKQDKIQQQDIQKQLNSIKKMLEEQRKLLLEIRKEERNNFKESKNGFKELKEYLDQQLSRRDDWGPRAAQLRLEAGEKPLWIIKCPSPGDDTKVRWGDYSYAMSLKKYLERLNLFVEIDTREDWGCESYADVVLVLRGCRFYRPDRRNQKCIYLMWNISHPGEVTTAEYELYDGVCVASSQYAEKLRKQIHVPVFELLQCTDTELFYPDKKPREVFQYDYIFIGNSRGIARNSVMWSIEKNLPFKMWGSGWNTILKDHMDKIEAFTIENKEIPELYRSSRVTVNDHWKDMLEEGFVNNRIFDALACGLPVISDSCDELKKIFPEAVLYYETKEEFDACVERMEKDYDIIRKCVAKQWPMIQEKYSFMARAKELQEIVKTLKNQQ